MASVKRLVQLLHQFSYRIDKQVWSTKKGVSRYWLTTASRWLIARQNAVSETHSGNQSVQQALLMAFRYHKSGGWVSYVTSVPNF